MLTFRNTNIFFLLLLLALLAVNHYITLPAYIFFLAFAIYLGLLFYGSYIVQSNFYTPVISSAGQHIKQIALSFDDGPDAANTGEILDILRGHGLEAVFFCIGKNIEKQEKLFRRIHAEGHLIGNHSYSHHGLFDFYSTRKMLADLQEMDEVTGKMIGLRPRLFRPPYGVTNPNLHRAIVKGNYIAIGWSIRSYDTAIKDGQKLLRRLSRQLKAGDIVLFHDRSQAMLSVLPAFIQLAKSRGLEIVRLDKLLKLEPYA